MKLPDIYWQMITTLLILSALGIATYSSPSLLLYNVSIAVFFAGVLDFSIKYYKYRLINFPKSGLITGLFVGIILDATTPLYAPAVVSTIAILSKHIIAYKRRNVFNPAAFGLVFSGTLLGFGDAWQIVPSSSMLSTILILALGVLVLYRIRVYYMSVPYLFLFMLLLTASRGYSFAVGTVLSPLVLFFALFMLTEHKTGPILPRGRVAYGLLVAVFSFVFFFYLPAYFLLGALLVGNVCRIAIERLIKK